MRARDRFRANVVFAGTATPHRERQLSELVEFGVAVWGPGWRRTKLRDYCRGELLNHEDYIRAYAGASVAINVAYCRRRRRRRRARRQPAAVRARGRSARPRSSRSIPTSTGISARAPRSWWPGTRGELRTLTSEALHDRAWADQVAAGARQRALTEHTYMHRLASLLRASVGPAPVLSAG